MRKIGEFNKIKAIKYLDLLSQFPAQKMEDHQKQIEK